MSRADHELRAIQAMVDPTPYPVDDSEVPGRRAPDSIWEQLHDGRWYRIEIADKKEGEKRRSSASSHGRRYGFRTETRQDANHIYVRYVKREVPTTSD